MNQIWLGPLLGNNRARLIERCAQLVAENQSETFLYLAASQPLLELVTQGILDGSIRHGVWGELPVYLFRGFVRRVLSTAIDEEGRTLPPRVPIDREELPLKRSLIAQILARLATAGRLKAIGPLAGREGCVNTVATLLGELQRAAKTPAEVAQIIAARTQDLSGQPGSERTASQIDFDNEVALIYSIYSELLNTNQLTEDDADQLRALAVLRGDAAIPWMDKLQLLILDGFFDFTPVQGEMLRQLIPRVPETLVNLNHDDRNPEIFAPFRETVSQLCSFATFELQQTSEQIVSSGALSALRENLFNPNLARPSNEDPEIDTTHRQTEIRYLECGDRDTEIRTIAREVKRLVIKEDYDLSDIALVVRQRTSYAPTISRVMREESVACNLELRVDAVDIPAVRAVLKLLSLLEELGPQAARLRPRRPEAYAAGGPPAVSGSGETQSPRISELADLIKSEYFRLGAEDLATLSANFDENYLSLLSDQTLDQQAKERLKTRYRIGFWDADALENAFAYVGSELPVKGWLARAHKLIAELPAATATKELLNIDQGAQDRDADIADQVENAETAKLEDKTVEKKRRPSRDIHPATLAWAALVTQRFAELIVAIPRLGQPVDLRLALIQLLDRFNFREQIARPARISTDDQELPQVLLNFNALESLQRALVAAIKSIEIATRSVAGTTTEGPLSTNLATFIEEVRRSLGSQSQVLDSADRSGLRVLEATDVRGLRFRTLFIAGLVEGGFPLRAARDWIYPHEERDRLKRYGLTLEDISPATLLKEEHYFYQAACRAMERLYLTRPLMLEDDAETVASYYVDELQRAVAPLEIETEIVRRDYDGKEVERASNTNELKVSLVRQQERHHHRGQQQNLQSQPRIRRLLTLARNDGFLSNSALRRIEIERERAGRFFGPYDGEITDPQLLSLLRQRFGPDYVHSASGLSVFGNCAYRFFAQRVLKLEPRGEAALDLQAIDAGKLLHDILRRFFERHRRQALNELNRGELLRELTTIADRVFDEHERVVPPLNRQIWKIDREIRKILLEQVLLYELNIQQEAASRKVLPAYFEVAFGGTRFSARDPDSTDEPLELTRHAFVGEEAIKISGQIDRVDLARDGTMVAYDYKLSTGSSKEDIKSGRSLQIPIYLEALEKLILPGHEVAGGGYYIIRGGSDRRNKGLHRASKIDYYNISGRTLAVMSDEEWQQIRLGVIEKIWEFLDQMREGRFVVNPAERKKTCRFCDFGAVCRYDRDRIERKKGSTDYPDYTDSELIS